MLLPVPATSSPELLKLVVIATLPPCAPVPVPMSMCTTCGVGVTVGVLVGVAVGVLVGVAVCVLVGVSVGVAVRVGVAVGVAVGVSVGVAVGMVVGVFVGVFVGVAVGVFVGGASVTVAEPSAPTTRLSGAPLGSTAVVLPLSNG